MEKKSKADAKQVKRQKRKDDDETTGPPIIQHPDVAEFGLPSDDVK